MTKPAAPKQGCASTRERPGDRSATTYFEIARTSLDPIAPPVSTEVPKQPATSPWSNDAGTEPPLGYDIEAVADVTKVER
jgi:hypothetical protein